MPTDSSWLVGYSQPDDNRPGVDLTALASLATRTRADGCSAALELLFQQSGLPFSITAVKYLDGEVNGHQGGNAIDLGAVDDLTIRGQLRALRNYIATIPQFFSFVAYTDTSDSATSLLVWDGQVRVPSNVPAAATVAAQCTGHIHVASSTDRILRAVAASSGAPAAGVVGGETAFYAAPGRPVGVTVVESERVKMW